MAGYNQMNGAYGEQPGINWPTVAAYGAGGVLAAGAIRMGAIKGKSMVSNSFLGDGYRRGAGWASRGGNWAKAKGKGAWSGMGGWKGIQGGFGSQGFADSYASSWISRSNMDIDATNRSIRSQHAKRVQHAQGRIGDISQRRDAARQAYRKSGYARDKAAAMRAKKEFKPTEAQMRARDAWVGADEKFRNTRGILKSKPSTMSHIGAADSYLGHLGQAAAGYFTAADMHAGAPVFKGANRALTAGARMGAAGLAVGVGVAALDFINPFSPGWND